MSQDNELRAELAEAQAELAGAVLDRENPELDGATVEARIEKARARCRRVRALIAERSRAQPAATPRRSKPAPEAGTSKPQEPAVQPKRTDPVPEVAQPKRPEERPQGVDPPAEKTTLHHRFRHVLGVLERLSGIRSAADWRAIARQSVTLLALVLAYLQYYFIDVHLQLSRLPSLAILVHG